MCYEPDLRLAFAREQESSRFLRDATISAFNFAKKIPCSKLGELKEPYLRLASNEKYVRDVAAHFSEETGEYIAPDQIREMIQRQAQGFTDKDLVRNTFVGDLLANVDIIKTEFVAKPWQVWEAPNEVEFVTSDNPLVTFLRITDELWHPGHGFRQENVVVAFPLSPRACLTMGIAGSEFLRVSESAVWRINEIVIRCSDRFVYARTPNAKIAQLVEAVGTTSVPGQNAFVGTFPDEKVIEAHLRRIMGIRKRVDASQV